MIKTRKKVLIITYYWPPSGGISVQRCLKFAKYLRKFDWEPVIYAPKNAHYPYTDEGTSKDIPEGLEIIYGRIMEPFRLFKILTGRKLKDPMINPLHARNKKSNIPEKLSVWIRANFFIPDARSYWIKPSVRRLTRYLKNNPVDAIFSDGPPHTNTVIACKLRQKFDIPWLADFQDPWTQVDYYHLFPITPRADKKHRKLEQEVFRYADKITIASPTWKKDLEQIGAKNVDVLYYGYDEEDFSHTHYKLSDEFIISHAGLMGYDRNPEAFLKSILEIINTNDSFKDRFKLILAGIVDYSILDLINHMGLTSYVELPGTISKEKAIELTMTSHMLLLPLNKAENNKGRIPGKFYECLRAGHPVIALGPVDSDVNQILRETGQGKCFDYNDVSGIKEFILENFIHSSDQKGAEVHKDVSAFSVYKQTARLAEYLDEINLRQHD